MWHLNEGGDYSIDIELAATFIELKNEKQGEIYGRWMWVVGVVVRRHIDFLILLIPTPLVSVLFCSSMTQK